MKWHAISMKTATTGLICLRTSKQGYSFLFSNFLLLGLSFVSRLKETLGPVLMIQGQLAYPRVNFASVFGPTHVTIRMSFSLPRDNFEIYGLPIVQHQVTRLAEITVVHVNRTQKLRRSKSSLAHAHINV